MTEKPFWKGKFIDRKWMKEEAKNYLKACAKGDIEGETGKFVNRMEEYMAGEVLLNTSEMIKSITASFNEAADDFLKPLAEGISEKQIKRRAKQLGEEEP